MIIPKFFPRHHFGRSIGAALACVVFALGASAATQESNARPDQVLWRNNRGVLNTMSGTVTANELDKITITQSSGRERTFESNEVQRVTFGAVPPSYQDGLAYFQREDFENAASMFALAAGDASARPVVQADARLRAVQSLMRHGAQDATAFGAAKAEAQRFLDDFPNNRAVPDARFLQARATRIGGDAAEAAGLFESLFHEASGETPKAGYPAVVSFRAGLGAADAYLAAGETQKAATLFGALEAALPRHLAALDADSPRRLDLLRLQARARLGEGFKLLAEGNTGQAKTFFEGQLRSAEKHDAALRFGAKLGLAEALVSNGDFRAAQLEFAAVSAIDHTDRDNTARALVGLAECALKLSYTNARADAKTWLATVQERYGDTPAVLRAQELLKGL